MSRSTSAKCGRYQATTCTPWRCARRRMSPTSFRSTRTPSDRVVVLGRLEVQRSSRPGAPCRRPMPASPRGAARPSPGTAVRSRTRRPRCRGPGTRGARALLRHRATPTSVPQRPRPPTHRSHRDEDRREPSTTDSDPTCSFHDPHHVTARVDRNGNPTRQPRCAPAAVVAPATWSRSSARASAAAASTSSALAFDCGLGASPSPSRRARRRSARAARRRPRGPSPDRRGPRRSRRAPR